MLQRAKDTMERLKKTLPFRTFLRYGRLRGNRLAGAVSFYGFISLFPMLIVAAAVVAQIAGPERIANLQEIVDENLPGLDLNVTVFVDNAGTIGLIGGVALLWSGLSWVDAMRAAVRSMWEKDDQPGNIVVRKALDLGALVGLGLVLALSWAATVLVGSAADQILDWIGLESAVLGRVAALILAVLSSSALFAYLLSGLPRIRVAWRVLIPISLVGGLVFELLKQVVTQFAVLAAPDSTYAAFAVPLALVGWIYVVTRVLMLLAAFAAEWAYDARRLGPIIQAA
ncbi:MAG TPA: YihY/virulence factor BrkB family protein [Jiangellaceae bacterium]